MKVGVYLQSSPFSATEEIFIGEYDLSDEIAEVLDLGASSPEGEYPLMSIYGELSHDRNFVKFLKDGIGRAPRSFDLLRIAILGGEP